MERLDQRGVPPNHGYRLSLTINDRSLYETSRCEKPYRDATFSGCTDEKLIAQPTLMAGQVHAGGSLTASTSSKNIDSGSRLIKASGSSVGQADG
jgi:hypothetical protein